MNVSSVYDLVNTSDRYPAAVPVLLSLLQVVRSEVILEGLIAALTVPEGQGMAVRPLVSLYESIASPPYRDDGADRLRWLIGNALTVVADESAREWLFAQLEHHGTENVPWSLAEVLPKYKGDPRIGPILMKLLKDRSIQQSYHQAARSAQDRGGARPFGLLPKNRDRIRLDSDDR